MRLGTLAALLLLLAATAVAQTTVRVDLPGAYDVVYDEARGRLYVSVADDTPERGSILALDPATGAVLDALDLDRGAARLALSDDGSTLYAGLLSRNAVARIDVAAWAVASTFSLGTDPFLGPRFANDIAVRPGDPDVVVVARRARFSSEDDTGTALYVDGVEQPETVTSAPAVAFGADPEAAFGYRGAGYGVPPPADPDTGLDQLLRLGLTADGLDRVVVAETNDDVPPPGVSSLFGPGGDFVVSADRLYGSNGVTVEAETGAFVAQYDRQLWDYDAVELAGRVSIEAVRPLPDLGRVAALARRDSVAYLVVYDLDSFEWLAYRALGTAGLRLEGSHSPRSLVRWGETGLAYVSEEGLVVIETDMLGADFAFAATNVGTVAFGEVDGPEERSVTVRNTGTAPLRVTAVTASEPDLSFTPSAFELAPGEAIEGTLRIQPRTTRNLAGTVTFEGNSVGPANLVVTASPRVPSFAYLDREIVLEEVAVGTEATVTTAMTNGRIRPIRVTGLRTTDPRFTVTPTTPATWVPYIVYLGQSQSVRVTFAPDAPGRVEAALIVESDAAVPVDTLQLVGIGVGGTDAEAGDVAADALGTPYPNPALGGARVAFSTSRPGPVRLVLLDVLGREVRVVLDGPHGGGERTVAVPTDGLPAGTYVVRLRAPGFEAARPVVVGR